ncbi:MAG: leucine-rich repeat domain-containing protein [Bacteroidia bacterium]|nr:leucine-rich repeat domain-containing protein [Bacteroidia bacterium]
MKHISFILIILIYSSTIYSQDTYSSLKKALKNPEDVKRLDLSGQKLKSLSPKISKLTSLTYLDLSGNSLTDLPNSIGNLKQLDSLNLKDNNLRYIPKSLCELKNLKWVSFKLNPVGAKSLNTPNINQVTGVYCLWKNKAFVEVDDKIYDPNKEFAGLKDFDFADTQPEPIDLDRIFNKIKDPSMHQGFTKDGLVVARIKVNAEGGYEEHRIIKSNDEALKAFVEKEIISLKFKPATLNGEPKAFWVNIPFKSRY